MIHNSCVVQLVASSFLSAKSNARGMLFTFESWPVPVYNTVTCNVYNSQIENKVLTDVKKSQS
jgi:hypothetical protein